VDRTSLDELVALMDRFALVVGLGPVHIARALCARGWSVCQRYRIVCPRLEYDGLIGINSEPAAQSFWRWTFFCLTCRDSTRAQPIA
jgi:hypothetical protein